MAQPAPEPHPEPAFRVRERTYGDNAEPLVEVLLLLHQWSIERELRTRAVIRLVPEAD